MSTAEAITPVRAESKIDRPLVIGTTRLVVAVVVLALYWAFSFATDWREMLTLGRFVSRMIPLLLLLFFFLGWWFTNRRMSRAERWLDFGVVALEFLVVGLLCDKSVGFFGLFLSGLPLVLTVGTPWLYLSRLIPATFQRRSLWIAMFLAWAAFIPFRFDGLDGSQHSKFSLRRSPTAEHLFLVERAHSSDAANNSKGPATAVNPVSLQPGDWPEFRGPQRDGQIHGLTIGTDWNKHSPKEIRRHRVGPAWSSMIIVNGRLYTQEQRGDSEAVVCYDAATGNEIWAHLDDGRFSENLSGAGPRATPTFADGRIYTLGGFGLADCLDAATGHVIWSRLIYAPAKGSKAAADSDAAVPQWGVSNSPLVVGDTAIFFTGAQPDKGMLAYTAKTGEPKWIAVAGKNSYASPQRLSVGGDSQLLMLSNHGLAAVDPATGHPLWEHVLNAGEMFSPIDQPQDVGDGRFLIHTPAGLALIQVTHEDGKWATKQLWESTKLKPSLNDFVVQDSAIYGFDDGIFCCLDLKTGKRLWKAGRYGHGQVLLLADQKLLLIVSETGELVVVAANAERHEELGRFQTISGKTWNHPIIAHGRLYVRNAEEMACYELAAAE